MKDLSVSQSYLICAFNENGKLPAAWPKLQLGPCLSTEIPVCLLAGSLIDLILAGSVSVGEDGKLCLAGELGRELPYLSSLYAFIQESKPMKADKLACAYAFTFSGKRMKRLIGDVGNSLAALGYAAAESGGLLGKTPYFIPDAKIVDTVVQGMRAELLESGAVSDEIVALASLMEKSRKISRYFSKYEKGQLQARLRQIRDSASNQLVKEMVDSVDTMVAVIAATSAAH